MNIKWLIGVAMLWIAGVGIDATLWGGYFALRPSLDPDAPMVYKTVNTLFSIPPPAGLVDWVLGWVGVFTWDFTFLDGNFQIIRWIMMAITVAVVYGIAREWFKIPIPFIGRS